MKPIEKRTITYETIEHQILIQEFMNTAGGKPSIYFVFSNDCEKLQKELDEILCENDYIPPILIKKSRPRYPKNKYSVSLIKDSKCIAVYWDSSHNDFIEIDKGAIKSLVEGDSFFDPTCGEMASLCRKNLIIICDTNPSEYLNNIKDAGFRIRTCLVQLEDPRLQVKIRSCDGIITAEAKIDGDYDMLYISDCYGNDYFITIKNLDDNNNEINESNIYIALYDGKMKEIDEISVTIGSLDCKLGPHFRVDCGYY